jgi:chlorocatechol 1,2-dioxygenase
MTSRTYRRGIAYIMKTFGQRELPLVIDAFLNTTVCQIENRNFGGSMSTLHRSSTSAFKRQDDVVQKGH